MMRGFVERDVVPPGGAWNGLAARAQTAVWPRPRPRARAAPQREMQRGRRAGERRDPATREQAEGRGPRRRAAVRRFRWAKRAQMATGREQGQRGSDDVVSEPALAGRDDRGHSGPSGDDARSSRSQGPGVTARAPGSRRRRSRSGRALVTYGTLSKLCGGGGERRVPLERVRDPRVVARRGVRRVQLATDVDEEDEHAERP